MTNPIESFEFVLKKQCTKMPKTLYNSNKQQNITTYNSYKPQDVISSVSLQIKAIQVADSIKSEKSVRNLSLLKKSTFLSVNNLPAYEVPKQTVKFDTQFATDTQLMNIIEDAELIDEQDGMTQEFESSFCQTEIEDKVDLRDRKRCIDVKSNVIRDEQNVLELRKDVSDCKLKNTNKTVEIIKKDTAVIATGINDDTDRPNTVIIDNIEVNVTEVTNDKNRLNTIADDDDSNNMFEHNNDDKNKGLTHECLDTQFEEYSQMLNKCIEIEDNDNDIERPVSPIFMQKNKPKSPSPLIFSLDKFEKFEQIAMSVLDIDDLNTAKRVINSQILNNELQIKVNEDIPPDKDENSIILQNEGKENPYTGMEFNLGVEDFNSEIQFLELDKEITEDLIKKVKGNNENTEILKDEILFSSDEEEFVQKSYQDLPFTCALETSFYNHPEDLDKTMFVGFQTASNKSIQIFTESFDQAQNLFSNVSDEEITITDLVNNCDGNKIDDQAKIDFISEDKELDSPCNDNVKTEDKVDRNKDENILKENAVNFSEEKIDLLPVHKSNFQGFKTASNKNIKLSEKALARCNKVFQDIDLNEDFYSQAEETGLHKEENKESIIPDILETKINKSLTEDIQSIDDVIIQEFENIEMSLEEDKNTQKVETSIENKTDNCPYIKMEENATEKYQDYVKDIDFDNDFSQVGTEADLPKNVTEIKSQNNENTNIDNKTADSVEISNESINKIIENIDLNRPSTSKSFIGFKTANNKNINVSKQALAKTINIFKDIDSLDFKLPEKSLETDKVGFNNNVNSDSNKGFEGFKTASKKNIAISNESLAKSANVFKDLDSDNFKLPAKVNKDINDANKDFWAIDQPSTSKTSFVGFKTANNKEIKISEESLAKTINFFNDIDVINCKDTENINDTERKKIDIEDFNKSVNLLPSFVGFKTANNKNIKISNTALAKTKSIFKDIDSDDFKFPLKSNNESQKDKTSEDNENIKAVYPIEDINKLAVDNNGPDKIYLNESFTSKARFVGFKTANNKKINISKESIAKTKNIFKDIEENDNTFAVKEKITKELEKKLPSHSNSGFIGFKTANNKEISVSATALAKTKNIFKDIDQQREEKKKEKDDYPIIIKDSYDTDLSNDHNEKTMENKVKDGPVNKFQGFKTASNKKVKVSEEALIKGKDIFKDIDRASEIDIKEKEYYPTNTDNNETEINEMKIMDNRTKDGTTPKFTGFTTASNKKVKISEEALIKSKNIFKDMDQDSQIDIKEKEYYPTNTDNNETEVNQIEHNSIPKFQGFTTASNKKVKISEEALLKSKNIFKDDCDEKLNEDISDANDPKNGNCSPIFKGFKTASKKTVTISKEALAKSKELFNDIDPTDLEPEFRGFETGNNNQVDITEKSLKETKNVFDDIQISGFKGFQTASDKKVVITEESLAKSRKLFHDFNVQDNVENSGVVDKKTSNIGFKTGSENKVVSEETIKRTKRRFSEIDDSTISNKKEKIPEVINDILDTQVLNNFEESLHTEDFHETPIKSKRSGSPILSCPKAKRRKKFETPYSTQKIPKQVTKIEKIDKNVNRITFTEDYKKNKCFSLKDLLKNKINNVKNIIDPYLLQFTFDTLLKFKFSGKRNNLTNSDLTVDELKELFSNSVNSKLIPNGWFENHIKFILWKLISYEVKFNFNVCDAKNVVDQLKYRYERELYNAQRPALRKVLEKDDVASKTMVLCVAGIYVDGVSVASATTTNLELLLTDGWYFIMATPDKMVAQLVCDGRITVGSKIVTNGAELVNCEQGVSPWEDTSAVRLKIFGNSTRRARWDARLGYHSNGAILSQLSAVKLDGGKVSKLRVFVARVYPAMYVEKFEDGSTVTRSERLEHLHQMKTEAERQTVMEKIYEEVEREFANQDSQDSEGLSDSCNRTCLDSGSQIAKLMKNSRDPGEFRAQLTSSQARLLESHASRRREHLLEVMQKRIRDRVEKAGVSVNRNVVTLLKIRVAGVDERGVTKGMMSIWKPTDGVQEIIREGAWLDVMNVVPTAVRYSEIQISAGRQSIFSASKYKEPEKIKSFTKLLKRKCFTIKDLAQNPAMSTDYNEIDTVGIIFLIEPSIKDFESSKQSFQNIYLADIDKNIICINFWGGLKKFGFHNVLDTGQVVYCVNLQKRAGNTRKAIPQYRVTEFSYFTKTPKNDNARMIIDDLNKKVLSLDRRKFCEECVELKNNYSVTKNNSENVSPYRFNNSDWNRSKNKMFIDSPLVKPNKIDDNFNLTGLDFESTFKQTDTQNLSEEVLIRKRKVNEKIAKLKMYGEPPPLTNLHIINKSKSASNSYKSPLLTKNNQKAGNSELSNAKSDSCVNVASSNISPGNRGDLNSSVVLNRTYVKSIDPVKINFDVKDDSNVDHFAEDFDGSPPLSLD